jgi:16S rRNA G966 N2-methylase RsmD
LKSRSLVLLSGEETTIPSAEARALFLTLDPNSKFETPEKRVLVADSEADPFAVGARIAFARRVGVAVGSPAEALGMLRGRRVRFRSFDLEPGRPPPLPGTYLEGSVAEVDLRRPELELTLVRGDRDYLAVTSPMTMAQGWSKRRPRSRAFFHPSAIFPKLSRALVNLSRCKPGGVFLDPFAGTGSLAIEASMVGAQVLSVDQSKKMAQGALTNMKHFGQDWLGVLRADSLHPPLTQVDAVATDVPYGKLSSTRGKEHPALLAEALTSLPSVMKTGSILVVMHPKSSAVAASPELSLVEEHHLYVHKLLTRTITILRRN